MTCNLGIMDALLLWWLGTIFVSVLVAFAVKWLLIQAFELIKYLTRRRHCDEH